MEDKSQTPGTVKEGGAHNGARPQGTRRRTEAERRPQALQSTTPPHRPHEAIRRSRFGSRRAEATQTKENLPESCDTSWRRGCQPRHPRDREAHWSCCDASRCLRPSGKFSTTTSGCVKVRGPYRSPACAPVRAPPRNKEGGGAPNCAPTFALERWARNSLFLNRPTHERKNSEVVPAAPYIEPVCHAVGVETVWCAMATPAASHNACGARELGNEGVRLCVKQCARGRVRKGPARRSENSTDPCAGPRAGPKPFGRRRNKMRRAATKTRDNFNSEPRSGL